jgi:hypothetical protein
VIVGSPGGASLSIAVLIFTFNLLYIIYITDASSKNVCIEVKKGTKYVVWKRKE